jgi:hypothetical protein
MKSSLDKAQKFKILAEKHFNKGFFHDSCLVYNKSIKEYIKALTAKDKAIDDIFKRIDSELCIKGIEEHGLIINGCDEFSLSASRIKKILTKIKQDAQKKRRVIVC